jgi:CubicO group peptidase (beta-lactamase class C family)
MIGHFAVSDRGLVRAVLAACLWCLALWLVVGTPAVALDGAAIPDALDRTYREWMSQNRLTTGSLAVMKDGAVVKSFGYGGLAATQPAPIASLSKAITAVCIARLVDEGRLSFTAPLATVLAPTFRKLGEPVDRRFKAITVEQLLKHRSGMRRDAPPEGATPRTMSETFSKVVRTPLEWDADARMSYSNIGYLTLGMVVEAVTGEDYETRCRRTVLAPMKAFGAIAPELRWRAQWRLAGFSHRLCEIHAGVRCRLGPARAAVAGLDCGAGRKRQICAGDVRAAHGERHHLLAQRQRGDADGRRLV